MQSDHTSRGDSLRSHSKSPPPTASGGVGPLQPACGTLSAANCLRTLMYRAVTPLQISWLVLKTASWHAWSLRRNSVHPGGIVGSRRQSSFFSNVDAANCLSTRMDLAVTPLQMIQCLFRAASCSRQSF